MKALHLSVLRFVTMLIIGAILLLINPLLAQKTTLAVIEFEGRGISKYEAETLTDRLRDELFHLNAFRVLERGMMESILSEQDFQLLGCTSNECLVEVGALLGAQQIVGGSIAKIGDIYTVSVRRIDIETGELLSVANYDHSGALEILLTQGMLEVATQLSNNQVAERKTPETLIIPESVPHSVPSTESTRGVAYVLVPIEIIRSTNGRMKGFSYDNKPLSRNRLKEILLSSKDKEIEEIVKRANRRFYGGTVLALAGAVAIAGAYTVTMGGEPQAPGNGEPQANGNEGGITLLDAAGPIGLLAALSGTALVVSRHKSILAAVKRYNHIATQQ